MHKERGKPTTEKGRGVMSVWLWHKKVFFLHRKRLRLVRFQKNKKKLHCDNADGGCGGKVTPATVELPGVDV
jgi:hypothetical protein